MASLPVTQASPLPAVKQPTFISKGIHAITATVSPIFLALGTALYGLHYAQRIQAFIITIPRVSAFIANPLLAGGLLAVGGILYIKKLWDQKVQKEQESKSHENQLSAQRAQIFAANTEVSLLRTQVLELQQKVQGASKFRNQLSKFIDETVDCEGVKYHITSFRFNAGSIKEIKLGIHDTGETSEFVAISELREDLKDPSKFQKFKVRKTTIDKCNECAAKNIGGGLGRILGVREIKGGRNEEGEKIEAVQQLIQPLYNQGNLWDEVDKLRPEDRVRIALEIFNCLLKLQSEGMAHGEVKAQNIQLHLDDKGILHGFLLDFDLTHKIEKSDLDEDKGYREKKLFLAAPMSWSPEIFFYGERSFRLGNDKVNVDRNKAEVWSLGMIFYMLFVKDFKHSEFFKSLDVEFEKHKDKEDTMKNFARKAGGKDLDFTFRVFKEWLDWDSIEMLDPRFESFKPILEKMLHPNPEKMLPPKPEKMLPPNPGEVLPSKPEKKLPHKPEMRCSLADIKVEFDKAVEGFK